MNFAGFVARQLAAGLARMRRRLQGLRPGSPFPGNIDLAHRRYQEIFENSSDAIFVIKVEKEHHFRFESMNPAALLALAPDQDDKTGFAAKTEKPLPNIPESIQMRIKQCLATGMPIKYESDLDVLPEKSKGTFDINLIPLASDNGLDRIFGFARDITARKRYEHMLHSREQEFRALAENSPDIIIRYDLECRRIYANPAYARLNSVSVQNREQNIHPTLLPTFQEKIKEVLQTGNNAAFDYEWVASDGSRQSYFLRAVPERDQHGHITSVLAILRDIGTLKETERRLKETQAQLRALASRRYAKQEEERKFIAHEMHEELGQVLATLRMHISMQRISSPTGLPPHLKEMLPLVDRAIDMVRTVTTALSPKVLDMGIEYALEWLTEEFTLYTGIGCQLHIDEDCTVLIDDKRARTIFSIVQESLDNVMRHAEASVVEVTLELKHERYCLQVLDDGKGFDTAASTDQSLGLVDIREQLLALGGSLLISSTPQRGTVLQAHIPIEENHEERNDSLIVG